MPDLTSRKPWYDYSELLVDVTTERNKCGMSNKYGSSQNNNNNNYNGKKKNLTAVLLFPVCLSCM